MHGESVGLLGSRDGERNETRRPYRRKISGRVESREGQEGSHHSTKDTSKLFD